MTAGDPKRTYLSSAALLRVTLSTIRRVRRFLVFHGDNKRMVFPSPSFWAGKDKPEMYKLLVAEIEQRNLTPVPSNTADYKFPKNVKVREGT